MAEENGESSSFQISSSSGGMAMPALDNGSRTSSHSGESSRSGRRGVIQNMAFRRNRPSQSRPRLLNRTSNMETEEGEFQGINMQSNTLAYDAREFHQTDSSSQDFTANLTHFQHLVDARQVHVDARSLNVTMLDPQITAQATEAVASSRVQAAQEVAQVVTQATQAVAEARETSNNAQLHAHHVTAEAQAHIGALQTELQRALERERQLQQRLQEQGNEINTLHSNMLTLANSLKIYPKKQRMVRV